MGKQCMITNQDTANYYLPSLILFLFLCIPYIRMNMKIIMSYLFLSHKNLPSNFLLDYMTYTFFHKKVNVLILIDHRVPFILSSSKYSIHHFGSLSIFHLGTSIPLSEYHSNNVVSIIRDIPIFLFLLINVCIRICQIRSVWFFRFFFNIRRFSICCG